MDDQEVIRYLTDRLDGVEVMENQGDAYLVYNPNGDVPYHRRFPFATVMTGDRYDSASHLDRPGAFRLNIGLTKQTYRERFHTEGVVDHMAEDVFMPHPVYAPQHWVCVVNPSRATLDGALPLIEEAYGFAVRKYRSGAQRGKGGGDGGGA